VPLVYVTGISGSGKSSVLEELRARGFSAYGVDEDGYGKWLDRISGEKRQLPAGREGLDMHRWFDAHAWVLDVDKIAVLKERSDRANETTFLCGVAAGDADAWSSFDVVCALVVDEETIKQRVDRRADAFGKRPHEMAEILRWNAGFEETYRGFGAVIVDATGGAVFVAPDPSKIGEIFMKALALDDGR